MGPGVAADAAANRVSRARRGSPPLRGESLAEPVDRLQSQLETLPREQGQLLPALHLAQEELGWVSRGAMTLIARRLKLTEAQVYGPATFYSEFRLSPPPQTLVTWCSGPTCRVLGGDRVRGILEATLGCAMGENGPDDRYGLWFGQCNGSCEQAPQIWVQGRVVGRLTLAQTARLARKIKAGEAVVSAPAEAVEIQPLPRARAERPAAAGGES